METKNGDISENGIQKMMNSLEKKLRVELDENHPYEAMLYVQTYVARKRRSLAHFDACQLILKGVEILIEYNEDQYAGTLFDWMLTQGVIDVTHLREVFDLTLRLISKVPKERASNFVVCIFNPLSEYLESNSTLTPLEKTRFLYELNQKCGEIFEMTKRWQDAKNSYLSIGDISSVVRITHLWADEGYPSEYSLFFARVYLSLLANKLIPQAAAFFRSATDEYLDSYEFTIQPDASFSASSSTTVTGPASASSSTTSPSHSFSIWQMCIVINDLLGLLDTPSVATKIDSTKIYGIILLRYEPLLKYYDPFLFDLSQQVGYRVFHIKEIKNEQNIGPMEMVNRLLMGGGGGGR